MSRRDADDYDSLDLSEVDHRAEFSERCPLRLCDGSGVVQDRHGFRFGPGENSDCECVEQIREHERQQDVTDELSYIAHEIITVHHRRTSEAA